MSDAIHDLVTRWAEEVWNQGNESTIDELTDPEAIWYSFPEPDSVVNVAGFKAATREIRAIFSQIHISVDEVVTQGNSVALRWTASMKYTGTGLGFPPTGESASLPGLTLFHLRNGRIYQTWHGFDLNRIVSRLIANAVKP